MLKEKRGSHVGVVLSFVIFIVFLVFLFSALQPALKTEKDKEAILEYIKNSIIELSSDNLTIESVIVDNIGNIYDCVKINKLESDKNIIVKDSSENIIDYYINSEIISDDLNADKSIFKIYYSKSIVAQPSPQPTCVNTKTNPDISFIDKETIIFVSKFKNVADGNYDLLKQELGINAGTDFTFTLLDANKTNITNMKKTDISTNVYVDEFPVLYANENGEIKSGFINIRVW